MDTSSALPAENGVWQTLYGSFIWGTATAAWVNNWGDWEDIAPGSPGKDSTSNSGKMSFCSPAGQPTTGPSLMKQRTQKWAADYLLKPSLKQNGLLFLGLVDYFRGRYLLLCGYLKPVPLKEPSSSGPIATVVRCASTTGRITMMMMIMMRRMMLLTMIPFFCGMEAVAASRNRCV